MNDTQLVTQAVVSGFNTSFIYSAMSRFESDLETYTRQLAGKLNELNCFQTLETHRNSGLMTHSLYYAAEEFKDAAGNKVGDYVVCSSFGRGVVKMPASVHSYGVPPS